MRLGWSLVLICAVLAGCTGECTNCVINDAGCPTCLPDGGQSRFNVYTIDTAQLPVQGFELIPTFQMALTPSGGIGFAYVELSADQSGASKPRDAGSDLTNYDIDYIEWNAGTVSAKEKVHGPVVVFVGVSLDYQSTGQPAVSYLGWATPPGYDLTQAFWYQNDAVIAYRNGSVWTEQTVVQTSGEAVSGDGTADQGIVVGLFPALLFDGTGAILAYKDVHNGSSIGLGDYQAADLELALGGPTAWTHQLLQIGKDHASPAPFCGSTTATVSRGSHNRFIRGASGNPALVSDIGRGSPTTPGADAYFTERKSGVWGCPTVVLRSGEATAVTNSENGPTLAYDPTEGYAIAVTSINSASGGPAALYKSCPPTLDCSLTNSWNVFQTVFSSGSGGFFASVAINPDTHEPWVAHYFCSTTAGKTVGSCVPTQDELKVSNSTRFGGVPGPWIDETVDVTGAFQTQMLYLSNPTRLAIGYRDPNTGALKLAVEKVQ
jgi:hypothetical protein